MPSFKVTTLQTPSGLEFKVGRDAQSNAKLTSNADGDDYWLHAEGPGAHAVLDGSATETDIRFVGLLLGKGKPTTLTVARCRDVTVSNRGLATVTNPTFVSCK